MAAAGASIRKRWEQTGIDLAAAGASISEFVRDLPGDIVGLAKLAEKDLPTHFAIR